MISTTSARRHVAGLSFVTLAFLLATNPAAAAGKPDVKTGPTADASTDRTKPPAIAEGADVVVTATRANQIAPVTASLQTTEPQSIISRSFIEDSLPATADFNQIALISPSVSNTGGTNGVGLSESKAQIRGFQDAEYNVTYDGVPFGDTNDPSHHSNTFFPSNTIETLIVDRGPGNASNLGQATFGGSINLFSRATREDAGIELKGSYGSFDTYLLRGLIQSGSIAALGGTQIVASAQHIDSNGARTLSPFRSTNGFAKIVIPIATGVRLSVLGTYNANTFNQPDNDGATTAQIAQFGKLFSLNDDPNSQTYYRYNRTHKTTDFEIAHLEAELAPGSVFDNRAYTYSYDNETLSGNDVTLYATATAAQIAAANVVKLTPGSAVTSVGIPGFTKTNKYRVFGDIAKVRLDFGFGALTAGAWLEFSNTYRQQRDVNLLTGARNYAEANPKNQITGATITTTPADIKFDQKSEGNHTEEFVELELRPVAGLTITPGFKHVDFNRKIDALFNQTTRVPQRLSKTYTTNLPFATINYLIVPQLSVYGQFAKGFLAPPLNQLYVANPAFSNAVPQRSTNYQAGAVYHGSALSLDLDVYKIDFKNKFISSTVAGQGVVFSNAGAVQYKGIEGQITYALPYGLAVFANGSRNYAKTDNPGAPRLQVARAPEYTAAGGVLLKHGPVRASLIDKYIGNQFFTATENPLYRNKGYHIAIASARYDIGPVRLGAEIDNLFDSRTVTNVSTGKTAQFDQYLYESGRQYTADLTITF